MWRAWSSTTGPAREFESGSYDETDGRWSVVLRRADGTTRAMHPRHVVMATGVSGIPSIPDIPSLKNFARQVLHASQYRDGEDWSGKRAIVIGTGNSGHDIAQDLYSSGARVTLVQRSPTLVVNIEPSAQLAYALYDEGPPTRGLRPDRDLDAVRAGAQEPHRAHRAGQEARQAAARRARRARLQARLRRRRLGLAVQVPRRAAAATTSMSAAPTWSPRAGSRWRSSPTSRASSPTARGCATARRIARRSRRAGDRLQGRRSIWCASCSATRSRQRVGPIWGFDDEQELRNMYVRTPQPGLWFIAGSLAQCRIYSKYLGAADQGAGGGAAVGRATTRRSNLHAGAGRARRCRAIPRSAAGKRTHEQRDIQCRSRCVCPPYAARTAARN